MTIGSRIKDARDYAKLSRGELADAVDCSYDLLTKLENDKRTGTLFLSKIAKACNVDFNWLETGVGNKELVNQYPKSERLKVLMNLAQQLPEYALDEVIRDAIKTAELIAKAQQSVTPKANGTQK